MRHSGSEDFLRLFKATVFAFVLVLVFRFIALELAWEQLCFSTVGPVVISIVFLAFSVGLRLFIRSLFQSIVNGPKKHQGLGILLFGAGSMGRSAKAAIDADVRSEGYAVAYIEDDPNKLGKTINGLPILTAELALSEDFVKRNNVQRVVLAAKNIGASRIKALTQQALAVGLEVKRVPPIGQWVNGELTATQIRNVSVEDLLGREPIHLSYDSLTGFIQGKNVLVTGAAGSIGSELVRQVLRQNPLRLIALDQAETPLYELDQEVNDRSGNFLPVIGSVADEARMAALFGTYHPQVVFHAAAYKHVPLMEDHPVEAIKTNCLGTAVVARLAREHRCEAFVMVSTDKAVNPTNVMGASKRVAEHVIQAENRHPQNVTRFVTTRFGNVLGSNGSVIPLFQKQIAQGGPVTITHKEITRFFMTIPEAVRLVLEAGHMGRGGELYVFDMGEPVRIYDLALNLIKLSGLKPGHDIAVREVGLRPGEKLYEELLADHENTVPTHHPKIFIAKATSWTDDDFTAHWTHLHTSLTDAHPAALRDALKRLVPEFVGESYS
jgi:FlaA1/EpsC-like NDP-sugar epimerase